MTDWKVRKANIDDTDKVVELSQDYEEFLMPYTFNPFVVRKYIDQFVVAEERLEPTEGIVGVGVGGTLHVIPSDESREGEGSFEKLSNFLLYVKQVPPDVIVDFLRTKNIAFIGQVICPGKGSFYSILEEMKKEYEEIWCWMSVVGPSYKSYKRYGFEFGEERTFWNIYKRDYSTFTLGKWRKE